MVRKFKDFIKDPRGRPKALPISHIGLSKWHEHADDLDKIAEKWNDKNFQHTLPLKKPTVKEEDHTSSSMITLPHYHYPQIHFNPKSFQAGDHISHEDSDTLYKALGQHYRVGENYTSEQTGMIRSYTRHSRDFNRYLIERHANPDERPPNKFHDEMHQHLLAAASQVATPHDLHLYAGVGSAHPGKHPSTVLPAWSSMSTNPSIAHSFAREDRSIKGIFNHPHIIQNRTTKQAAVVHPDVMEEIKKKIPNEYSLANHMDHIHQAMFGTNVNWDHDVFVSPVRHLIKAQVPAGSHMVHVGEAGDETFHEEQEMIAPGGSILHHDESKVPILHGNGVLVHHTKLITPPELSPHHNPNQMKFNF